jgi:hypothetical protein
VGNSGVVDVVVVVVVFVAFATEVDEVVDDVVLVLVELEVLVVLDVVAELVEEVELDEVELEDVDVELDNEEEVVLEVEVEVLEELLVELDTEGAGNSRTLLLAVSATQRLPATSKVAPPGILNPFGLVAGPPGPKFGWPMTIEAVMPFEKGGWKPTNLLLPVSVTHRSPAPSKVTEVGMKRPPRPAPRTPAVKLDCPMTAEACIPLENGAMNSTTRLFRPSSTQRFPLESKATSVGLMKELAVVPF